MLTYEDSNFFALELLETKDEQEAQRFQREVSIGAILYQTKTLIDMFLYFNTLMDYQGNQLREFHDPVWFLKTVVAEAIIPENEEGIVCICWKVNPRDISRDYSVVVKGEQAYKVDILNRLNQMGLL